MSAYDKAGLRLKKRRKALRSLAKEKDEIERKQIHRLLKKKGLTDGT